MRIVETRDDASPLKVDSFRLSTRCIKKLFTPYGLDPPSGHGNGRYLRMPMIEGGDGSIMQNQFGCMHELTSLISAKARG
jgi:hypothetical protein